jgi:hypothetical protein
MRQKFVANNWQELQQEILGRTNRPLSFHCILSVWYDTDHIENTASNSSSIVAYVLFATRMF